VSKIYPLFKVEVKNMKFNDSNEIILNKENLLSFYEVKKRVINEMIEDSNLKNRKSDIERFNIQLNFIDALIKDLDYFESDNNS
jgi:hypothetical protein